MTPEQRKAAMAAILSRVAVGGCWEWLKSKQKRYGCLYWNGKNQRAHRLAWEAWRDEPIGDLHVLHTCDNPGCCNPDHLFLGTQANNIADMWKKHRARLPDTRGEQNPAARLSAVQVAEIRRDPRSSTKLAPLYGVHKTTIQLARKENGTWREVV